MPGTEGRVRERRPAGREVAPAGTWWLSKGREFALAATLEKAVADALAANPCLDVTSNEMALVELAGRIEQRAKAIEDGLRAVVAAKDVDRALEEHPEVARHFGEAFLDLTHLDLDAAVLRRDGCNSTGA